MEMPQNAQGKEDLEWKNKFLKQCLENAYTNLKDAEEGDWREIFGEEVKELKKWLQEFASDSGEITKCEESLDWRIYFLKFELDCVEQILEAEEDLPNEDRKCFENEANRIKKFIKELKKGRKANH